MVVFIGEKAAGLFHQFAQGAPGQSGERFEKHQSLLSPFRLGKQRRFAGKIGFQGGDIQTAASLARQIDLLAAKGFGQSYQVRTGRPGQDLGLTGKVGGIVIDQGAYIHGDRLLYGISHRDRDKVPSAVLPFSPEGRRKGP